MLTVKGLRGSLRWGYHDAAEVGAWTMTPISGGGGWTLTATVSKVNTFRVSQRPVVFVAPHADGAWRFPVTELQITDAALTARLGPREK